MWKYFFIVILSLSVLPLQGYGQEGAKTYSLKECVETAIANNLTVQQNQLQMQSDEINWKQSKLNMLPDLNGSIGHGINQGRSIDPFTNSYVNEKVNFANYSLSSGVILFNGMAVQNGIRQSNLSYQASKMDWQQSKDNITLNIILSYVAVLSNEDLLSQLQARAELTRKQVERLDVLNLQGAINPSLLYDLKGQLASDQLQVINTTNDLENARLNLCQLMNIKYDKGMQLERLEPSTFSLTYAETPSQIYEKALSQFAQIRAAELRTRSAEKAVKARRGELFPTLSLNGSANSNYSSAAMQNVLVNTSTVATGDYVVVNSVQTPVMRQQNNFNQEKISYSKQLNNNIFTSVSLNLRIPIFNSLFTRNRIKLAKLDVKNFSLVEQTAKTTLQQNIERAYANMTASFARYKTILEQVNAYAESFRAAEIRFNEGVGTSIDYLTAKNNLDRANNNLVFIKYDYVLRTKILDYYQGRVSW
jgi:outer membrane protein